MRATGEIANAQRGVVAATDVERAQSDMEFVCDIEEDSGFSLKDRVEHSMCRRVSVSPEANESARDASSSCPRHVPIKKAERAQR